MELNLQPLASSCFVSGRPFAEGDRVMSFLVRSAFAKASADKAPSLEIRRFDLLAAEAGAFAPEGVVACSWAQAFKPRAKDDNPDRTLKLTAETLFLTLADPATVPTPENTRLIQFLAVMLERKRLLRPRGRSADGARNLFEHSRTKQLYEVPADELTPEFFLAIQEQLTVLVGEPKPKAEKVAAVAPETGG
jgi:hypothetical protein